jgi:hypothetical protein
VEQRAAPDHRLLLGNESEKGYGAVRFKVQSSRFKVQSSKFRVRSSRFKVQSSRFKVQGSRFKVQKGSRFFKVQGSRFKVLKVSRFEGVNGHHAAYSSASLLGRPMLALRRVMAPTPLNTVPRGCSEQRV